MQNKKQLTGFFNLLLIGFFATTLFACGGGDSESGQSGTTGTAEQQDETEVSEEVDALADPMKVKGVGPIDEINIPEEIDQQMADEGQQIFESYCTACHKIEERFVGPPLKEVTTRRSPEWIMNMILNPEVMVKEDPIAKELLKEYLSPMANQNLKEEEARKILEYFRTLSEVESLNGDA